MIKVYPIKIEAVDADDESHVLFTLESFDEHCATLNMDKLVWPDKLDELLDLKPGDRE